MMRAIKAQFDGKQIILPADISNVPPGEVVVVFEAEVPADDGLQGWMKLQESVFAKVWDNDEDAVYDSL